MINVDFYTFSKRKNSTKKPTGTAHTVAVSFKETTDLENPTIEVHDATIGSYNYAYIGYTGRYYFVSRRRSIAKDTFEIDLVEDYLASAIDSIRGQAVYCAMSSVNYNVNLDDARVSPMPQPTITPADCAFEVIETDTNGDPTDHVISTVITTDGEFNGVDVIYAWDEWDNYIKKLGNADFYKDLKNAMGGGDPMDYVCEVWTTLLKPSACHSSVVKGVVIGDDEHPYEVGAITDLAPKRYNHDIIIPQPSVSDFRYSEKYVKYYLVLPFIGIITIPTDVVRNSAHLLSISFGGEILSGQLVITAKIGSINLGVYGTSLKSPLPLNKQSGAGASMLVNGVGGALGGAGTGMALGGAWGALGGAITGAAMGVAKAAMQGSSVEKTSSSVGSIALGALFKSFSKPTVVLVEYASDIDPATLTPFGRPCEKVVTVANGYMQTRNASFSFAGTDSEIDQVNRAFDTGVYVE